MTTNEAKLDISSLEKTVVRLDEGLTRYLKDVTDTQIRDGLIQRFEFTYELSHKMLKRYLEASAASPSQYDDMPFADLTRVGNEHGLLASEWPAWRTFRQMRGRTSHTYDEKVAIQVVAAIPEFLREAMYLRDQLRKRLA